MTAQRSFSLLPCAAVSALFAINCGDGVGQAGGSGGSGGSGGGGATDGSSPGTGPTQTPPQGTAAMDAWISAGHYKTWRCEATASSARPNGAHGANRICSNDLASQHGAGEYPVGAASVKELHSSVTGTTPTGHAVALKVASGKTGAAWYWYEKIGARVVADGANVGICAGCHSLAGADATHQGHDFVYLQVK